MAKATSNLDIDTYNKKRDFSKTKEPKGRTLKGKGDAFVVQKHDASHLHWDFRLEMDGVLKSWAVPKGPSLDPGENRLAMRTEDHPLDYGSFEGAIPKAEYGGGTVMLWDQGRWIPHPDKDPRKTIDEGHLHFTLEGERMKGDWVMFRLKGRPGEKRESWMLKKVTDEEANADNGSALVDECVTSVTTGRTMAEIASGEDVWRSNRGGQKGGRAKKKASEAPPDFRSPQLATLVDEVPAGKDWLFEYKYDGYRLLIATGSGAATAWTRNGKDWSDKFRALVKAAEALPTGCLIDGEAVALGKKGKPDFQLLQSTLKDSKGKNLVFYAFDLLVDRGEDITKLSNLERKGRLQALLEKSPSVILYGDHVIAKGEALLNAICEESGEGVIAKKASAPYRPGRNKFWLKIKCINRQEFVIVGWSESDKRVGFRSLLLAAKEKGKLTYVGKVGTGFNTQLLHDLTDRMKPLEVKEAPVEVPRADRKGAHYIKPELVAEIAFAEFTSEGILRHPSFIALREDKPASDVVVETPKDLPKSAKPAKKTASKKRDHPTAESLGVKVSNPDRTIFPTEKLTKGDLAAYYAAIGPLMMVTSANRPMTLIRCPQGRAKKCFFQKHDTGSMGDHVKHVPIAEKKGGTQDYLYMEDIRGILACVQM
ncbi:MAG: DNA ligase D, partial [Pseudomonadota bacterium]|nr:DNA ligase D [Pseudomonadota bacterium]